jgi:hypothetical protein
MAGEDLSAWQYRAVYLEDSPPYPPGYMKATSPSGMVAGILQNKPEVYESASVMLCGISKAIAGATFSKGTSLMIDSEGRYVPATGTGKLLSAVARETATAVDQIISVDIGFMQYKML